jgi:hypothetical protein
LLFVLQYVSFIYMKQIVRQRKKLLRDLPNLTDILRGSLLHRIIRHRQGCPKCDRGEGHPVSVLAVSYPGRRIRHISLRSEQTPEVQRQLENYQQLKASLEQMCELNQQALRTNLADSKSRRRAHD